MEWKLECISHGQMLEKWNRDEDEHGDEEYGTTYHTLGLRSAMYKHTEN